ncbi:MFS transporter [Pseudonocardia zijingensis]|jgi:MFS family permease|uniref:MFS transporter n=1 Tax=Pseudonocardia zijingensis TaxID=153376 RepID=A0ABP3YSH4_9PSEU
MSSSASLADYRAALTAPGAAVPVLASAVGRFPIAMLPLATLLYVQRATGSFAAAGLVSAGQMIGVAAGSVAQGRVVDRLGPSRPLQVIVVLFVLAVGALVAAVESAQPLPVVVVLATVAGAVRPALEGASRSLWTTLVPPGPTRAAALTYEAISLEVFFILGPAIAAFLVAAPWPGLGLAVACTAMSLGAGAFALSRPARGIGHAPAREGVSLLGALARPGMRTVAVAALGFGLVIGSVEVGVPAVTAAVGSPTLGGVLLSAWSISSVLAGVLYGMRPWPRPLHLRMPALLGGFAVLVAAMALVGPTGSLAVLVITMVFSGALITPQVTGHSLAVDIAAPPGAAAEAFGWVITAATLGIATGQSSAGIVVEQFGPAAAFVSGGTAGVVLAAVLWLRRATLLPRPAQPSAAVA